MKRKRTKAEMAAAISEFQGRLDWLESSWGCRTEYEVDESTGRGWFKITMPDSNTSLMVWCHADDVALPSATPRP